MSPFLVTFLLNLLALFGSILNILKLIVLVAAVLSWLVTFDVVNVRNRTVYQIMAMLQNISDRLLFPIRRFVPSIAGLDVSPLIFLFLCWMVQRLLLEPLAIQIQTLGG